MMRKAKNDTLMEDSISSESAHQDFTGYQQGRLHPTDGVQIPDEAISPTGSGHSNIVLPDPDSHKFTWDMCFIPLFQTKICDDLRSKLNQDIITALEYGKTDIWDNGARAYW